jgi:hypothetical protein
MPPVAGRIRVVGRSDGVAVADATVATVDADLAASEVPNDLLGTALGVCLGVVMRARTAGAGSLHIPSAVCVRDNMSVV